VEAWQHIFELCSVIMIACGLVYIFFNDASLQPWNKPPAIILEDKDMKEMMMMNNNNNEIDTRDFKDEKEEEEKIKEKQPE
jgi:hypothetical protein